MTGGAASPPARTFPGTVLRTRRFVLRGFTADDVEHTRAACADESTQRWLPLPRPYTHDDAVAWCTKIAHELRESGDGVHFAVTEPGGCGGHGAPAG